MAHYKALVCLGLVCFAFAVAAGKHVDNHGNVHATQSQSQTSTNNAVGNNGPVNQQSNNQAIQQAGNGNSATNSNNQHIKGRRLAGWYIDNSGDVDADQSQSQSSSNYASYNNGPVNQQSNNQAIQQAGNGNSAENDNDQTIEGRKLLGWYKYWVDNSGDVDADQSQSQSSTNNAVGNNGPVNQQSNNQAIQQAGNGNSATNSNHQHIKGRKLLGWYIDNSGDVDADQSQDQSSSNYASYNNGPVNQQSNNQAIQQAGNGNSAENDNDQTIEGRKLLGWYKYWVDNSGDVYADQSQSQSSTNNAVGNNGPVNQQSNNQAIQQAGNGNSATNSNHQHIKG